MNNLSILKPFIEETSGLRSRAYRKFWNGALLYLVDGKMPDFLSEQKDTYGIRSTFSRFKSIVDLGLDIPELVCNAENKSMYHKTENTNPTPVVEDVSDRIIDALSYESEMFTDVERVLLQDMIKKGKSRPEYFRSTPFVYSVKDWGKICGNDNYKVFYKLIGKLEANNLITRYAPDERITANRYQFDEKRLLNYITQCGCSC